ncbi:hypothetical protein [Haloarcula hispanica pleomorphic virus 4]|uniref:Uncharacterized protein n=1 Tax=Haloarcula hispanica pleomorphic virus 4 TaxID=1980140 RepID=A0A2P0QEH4_9VIRU|nr:hypothetical protein HOS97_gp19 [Haloarcula hispanica pleomorphic virus 4]ARM71133.1 hypothetical protein [Haloarcula hispanica pleomorphic virus 4]
MVVNTRHMVVKCEYQSGMLSRGNTRGRQQVTSYSGQGCLKQISIRFDGGNSDVADSYVEVDYDGSSVVYPSPKEIHESHRANTSGTTCVNITTYQSSNYHTYGCFVRPESQFNNSLTIVVHNGDDLSKTMYHCMVVYNE